MNTKHIRIRAGLKKILNGDIQSMNHIARQFSMGMVAFAVMQVANAQVQITNVVPVTLAGQQGTEIRVMFNGLPPQPQAYQMEQPSRLVLDFDRAGQQLKQNNIAVATNEASSINVTSDAQRSRLTVNLKETGEFTTRIEGNTFILKINSKQANTTPIAQLTPTVSLGQQGISNIGFERGAQGDGQVVIDLLGKNTPIDVQQQGSKVIVRVLGNKIPVHLARRLNVNDFATPVSTIDAYNEGGNGIITVQSSGNYEYMAYQAENKLTLSLKRPEERNSLRRASPTYTGKKVSLDFQDIEVRRVLQLLADFTDINMVTADSVQGNITLRLKDVPWDQALEIILRAKSLGEKRNGNVIWIAPITELAKMDEDEAKAIQQNIKLAPLQTEYVVLNYAKASDIQKLIKEAGNGNVAGSNATNGTTGSADGSAGSLLSGRGTVTVDARTNTLIVTDTQAKLSEVRKMLERLDVPVSQIMVEARIVRASTEFSNELGVSWGLSKPTNTSSWDNGKYTNSSGLSVDLGPSTSYGSLSLGLLRLGSNILDLQLAASQSDGRSEILSTPKVMTGDKQQAVIRSGLKIPYQTTSANTGTTTTFQDAVLELKVIPSITPDGKVQMNLDISKDTLGTLTDAGYAIDTNKLQTNVLVSNGETVVLGGLYEDEQTGTIKKVPVLGDIPYVGNMFKNRSKTISKRELLIFVTPRIVNDTVWRNQ